LVGAHLQPVVVAAAAAVLIHPNYVISFDR
jgi:hypothetical protein